MRRGAIMGDRKFLSVLYRPAWIPTWVTLLLLFLALVLLVGLAWYSREQLRPVVRHMAELSRLQDTGLRVQELLVARLRAEGPVDPRVREELQGELDAILDLNSHLNKETPIALARARTILDALQDRPREALILTLAEIRKVLQLETRAHGTLVKQVYRAENVELEIAVAALITLPLIALSVLALMRRRILSPLDQLGRLIEQLSHADYRQVPIEGVDPVLRPLFERYNELVERLERMQSEHESRRRSLEQEVALATGTLLEQQRRLADAERLAAVGELAARIAHELRNPLAGMQMALKNLRNDVSDPDHAERLGLVIAELDRIFELLNGLLEQARQQPEPSRQVDLATVSGEVAGLVRYQLPDGIRLEQEVADQTRCRLPENGLRQTLLNLLLNARQALGDGPGTIRLRARRREGWLMLEIEDDGPGFPESLRDGRIRPFVSSRPDGTGLGLAMVRRFVAELGGHLRLNNLQPHGARITLELPCSDHDG